MTDPATLPQKVRDAIGDLCVIIGENATLKNGIYRARAAALAKRLAQPADIILSDDEIVLAVDMAEAVATAVVEGRPLEGAGVLMRVTERVITPITDALGYPGDVRS
jgi:hypothetical protein